MRYETIEGTTHIWCDEGESEQDVLRAIANATFETAGAIGLGLLHFNGETTLPEDFLDQAIDLTGSLALNLDYVQGRQVKTCINRVGDGDGHFTLANRLFERDRGAPDTMLTRAQAILAGAEVTGTQSTMHMFEGNSLDVRVQERYRIDRLPGETDWELRQRVFLDFYEEDQGALEYLLGGTIGDFDDVDMLLMVLNAESFNSRHGRQRFIDGFAGDPLEDRKQRMSAHTG